MQTLKTKVVRILGIIFFVFAVIISSNLPTAAKPTNPCNDICSNQANRPCIYIVGHGMCYGVGIWE